MAGEFEGQVAVITGACGNLGQAVVAKMAAGGAKLVLIDREMERIKAVAEQQPVESLPVEADLTDPAAVDALVMQTEARFGRIDILAHTVGGFASGDPVHAGNLDVLDRMFALNVRPVYLVCGRVARHMVEHNIQGKIVVVLARSGLKGSANQGAYTASKAAAQRIVESMALELRDRGIRVNGVMPSIIDTPPNRQSMPNADFSKWVTPQMVADAIGFLVSDSSGAFHGSSLEVYGRV